MADIEQPRKGTNGTNGTNGSNGTNGTNGADGHATPTGGSTGQVLTKNSNTAFNLKWS